MSANRDRSETAFEILRDRRAPEEVRLQAFEEMLQLGHGWWGNGSLAAFARAVALAMSRYVRPRTRISADALDWEGIAHETLLRFFVRAHTIDSANPRTWLIGTMHKIVQDELRRAGPELFAQRTSDPSVSAKLVQTDTLQEEDTPRDVRDRARYEAIRQAIHELPPARRLVIEKYYFENASTQEIAESLDMSPAAVRQHLHRGRAQLKSSLDARSRPARKRSTKS